MAKMNGSVCINDENGKHTVGEAFEEDGKIHVRCIKCGMVAVVGQLAWQDEEIFGGAKAKKVVVN